MVVVAAVALLVVRPRNRIRTAWLAMVIVLAPWLSIRTSPWLIGPTIIALVVLFVLAANADRGLPGTFPALGRGSRVVAAGLRHPAGSGQGGCVRSAERRNAADPPAR